MLERDTICCFLETMLQNYNPRNAILVMLLRSPRSLAQPVQKKKNPIKKKMRGTFECCATCLSAFEMSQNPLHNLEMSI